jgi:hypothetical protein
MWLRFVIRHPVSTVTIGFLAWCSAQLVAQGFTAVLLIWDNASCTAATPCGTGCASTSNRSSGAHLACASWSVSCRAKVCGLTPLEPKWSHGKRAVSEPDRLLSADELAAWVYAY